MNFLSFFICGCNNSPVKEIPQPNTENRRTSNSRSARRILSTHNTTQLVSQTLSIPSTGHSPTSSISSYPSTPIPTETINNKSHVQKKYLSERELAKLSPAERFKQSARHRRSTDVISITVKPPSGPPSHQHSEIPSLNLSRISLPGTLENSLEDSPDKLTSPISPNIQIPISHSKSGDTILASQQQRDFLIEL